MKCTSSSFRYKTPTSICENDLKQMKIKWCSQKVWSSRRAAKPQSQAGPHVCPLDLECGFPEVLSPLKRSEVRRAFLPAACQRRILGDKSSTETERTQTQDTFQEFLQRTSASGTAEENKYGFLLSLTGFYTRSLNAAEQPEMRVTDRLQNFNLISREHLYGDTNQTAFFSLSRLIKTASQLKWQKKKKSWIDKRKQTSQGKQRHIKMCSWW